jgi:hypothetical protein
MIGCQMAIASWSDAVRIRGAGGDVSGEFAVAASEVLDKGVPGGQDPRGPVAFQAAYRPQPGFQPPVTGLGRVVRVAFDGMQC